MSFNKKIDIQNILQWAVIVVNLGLSIYLFYRGLFNENQNFAITLFKDYSTLVLAQENRSFLDTSSVNKLDLFTRVNKIDSASVAAQARCDEYKYFVGFVLFYAESIYNLMSGNEAWVNTVKFMLEPHYRYLTTEKIIDEAYSEEFQQFSKIYLQELTEIKLRTSVSTVLNGSGK